MDHYMPEIFWHDRKAILSVDFHPVIKNGKYKIVTASVQKEVRIWEFEYEKVNLDVAPLGVTFVANLSGHNAAINQVKFSHNPDLNLLASGDCDGRVAIWQLSEVPSTAPPTDDLPPNKENWVRLKVLNHDSDVSALVWSPDGKFVASVSNDDSLLVHDAVTGKRIVTLRNFRHFPNGISWDPKGKYLVTMSTDRKMDLIDASKGTRLRCYGSADLPAVKIGDIALEQKNYKLFHDDQLMSFQRGVSFSPCGQLIIAPCGHLEVGPVDIFGSFVFKRIDLENEKPTAFLPSTRPTFLIRCCPIIMSLENSEGNYLGLPYRVLWLALTKDSVLFYDSQHQHPIGLVDNIHYNSLTDAAWSSDGKNVVISSLEGYCSFLKLNLERWGCIIEREYIPECPLSPQLIPMKKRKNKEKKERSFHGNSHEEEKCESSHTAKLTPLRSGTAPSTPKSGGIFKYLQPKEDKNAEMEEKTPSTQSPISRFQIKKAESGDARPKKRIQLITLIE